MTCPYRGLNSFDLDHAKFFCGRGRILKRALSRIDEICAARNSTRVLAVVGASGSGKSSLAKAGVLYNLMNSAPDNGRWLNVTMRPEQDPLENLALAVLRLRSNDRSGKALRDLADRMLQDPRTLHAELKALSIDAAEPPRVVLLVDQFEEVWTQCRTDKLRDQFVANLLSAARAGGGPGFVLITLRADYYGHCAAYPEFAAVLEQQQVLVGAMEEGELRDADRRTRAPCRRSNRTGADRPPGPGRDWAPGFAPVARICPDGALAAIRRDAVGGRLPCHGRLGWSTRHARRKGVCRMAKTNKPYVAR